MGAPSAICRALARPAALLLPLLLVCAAIGGAAADAMVTGAVFCDQCRDGQRSLFDYPLYGARVAVACAGADGQVGLREEGMTNWFGTYGVRFGGSPDMSRCFAQVVGGPEGCGAGAGPARGLNLLFRMFGMELYTVDALLAMPAQPMFFCSKFSPYPALPGPGTGAVGHLPPETPALPLLPPLSPPVDGSRPPWMPFPPASACPYEKWAMQEYRCYWKVVRPETKVAVAFGLIAAQRYGPDMTLMDGLRGRGGLNRTLLREATTALLNSYNSLPFFYPTLSVIDHMNRALLGSPRKALMVSLRFRRANSGAAGYGNAHCTFSPCN